MKVRLPAARGYVTGTAWLALSLLLLVAGIDVLVEASGLAERLVGTGLLALGLLLEREWAESRHRDPDGAAGPFGYVDEVAVFDRAAGVVWHHRGVCSDEDWVGAPLRDGGNGGYEAARADVGRHLAEAHS